MSAVQPGATAEAGVQPTADSRTGGASDRLLPLIAFERSVRAVVLVAVGVIAIVKLHADWGHAIDDVARAFGLASRSNALGHLINKASALSDTKHVEYGAIAIGYGILEGVEAYGLWRKRRWGEYLTIVATALLLIPEIDELIKRPTVLKACGFLLNLAIVIVLVVRVRRRPGRG